MDLNGNQVIAVDFDGTLCKQAWPEIGEENEILIEHLKEQQAAGARLILWTNREGDLLEEAVEWCKARGLTFDTVNANLPELIDLYKNDCRKINADIYIDDKAVNPVPYRHAAGMFGFNPYANPIDKAEFEKRRSNHVEKNQKSDQDRKKKQQGQKTEKENKRNSSGNIHPDKLRDTAGVGISRRILCRNRRSGGSSRRNYQRTARPDLTGSSLYQRGGT